MSPHPQGLWTLANGLHSWLQPVPAAARSTGATTLPRPHTNKTVGSGLNP